MIQLALHLENVAAIVCILGPIVRVAGSAALLLTQAKSKRSETIARLPWTSVHTAAAAEPLALLIGTLWLAAAHDYAAASDAYRAFIACCGIVLIFCALSLLLWTVLTGPVYIGHYVTSDQTLRTTGPYSLVRHPLYLGVIGLWLGVSTIMLSPICLGVTLFAVLPLYLAYIRAEEHLLQMAFGQSYARYASQVPQLLPGYSTGRRVPGAQESHSK